MSQFAIQMALQTPAKKGMDYASAKSVPARVLGVKIVAKGTEIAGRSGNFGKRQGLQALINWGRYHLIATFTTFNTEAHLPLWSALLGR